MIKKYISNVGFTVALLTALIPAGEADKLRLAVVFRDILGDVISDIHRQYPELGRAQEFDEMAKRGRCYDYSYAACNNSRLMTLSYQCEKLGLSHEAEQLAD